MPAFTGEEISEAFSDVAREVRSVRSNAELLAEMEAGINRAEAEMLVGGKPLPPVRACEHRTLGNQMIVALVEPDSGEQEWEVLIKLRCLTCGVPFDVRPSSARAPLTAPHGVVVRARPVPET